jgi:hypothetical protein
LIGPRFIPPTRAGPQRPLVDLRSMLLSQAPMDANPRAIRAIGVRMSIRPTLVWTSMPIGSTRN